MLVKKSLHSLTGKLIIAIGTLMVVGSAIFWYFLIQRQEKELLGYAVKYGSSFIDHVKENTRNEMLAFRPHLVQQTLEVLGSGEGVINVRILDVKGRIAYSSIKERKGALLDKNETPCISCHSKPSGKSEMPLWAINRGKEGYRMLTIVRPIHNEPACYTSSCHIHPKEQKIIGFVKADLSLSILDETLKKQKIAITAFLIGFICLLSGVLCTILWKLVSVPLSMLTHGMKQVAAGELDYVVEIKTKDEIGELAGAFNAMTADLSIAKKS